MIMLQNGYMNINLNISKYKDLLSIKDLEEILGISKQTTYRELRNGRFGEPLKFGREYRIPKVYIIEKYFQGYIM